MALPKISLKVAYPIIIGGLFIIVVYMALNYQNLDLSFYAIFSLLVIYIFLFGFSVGQRFASPIKNLLAMANKVNKGNLESRYYLESKDELGELAGVLNKIAEKLQQSRSESEVLEKSVALKVKAQTRELEETISALEQKVKNRTLEARETLEELKNVQKQLGDREAEIVKLEERASRSRKKANGVGRAGNSSGKPKTNNNLAN